MVSVDGAKIGSPYEEHEHTGALPAVEVEGGQLYTGSCHCGKLTIAAHLKTVDDDEDSGMIECNCSICERVNPAETRKRSPPSAESLTTRGWLC